MAERTYYIINWKSSKEEASRVIRGPVTGEYLLKTFPSNGMIESVQEINYATFKALREYYKDR